MTLLYWENAKFSKCALEVYMRHQEAALLFRITPQMVIEVTLTMGKMLRIGKRKSCSGLHFICIGDTSYKNRPHSTVFGEVWCREVRATATGRSDEPREEVPKPPLFFSSNR